MIERMHARPGPTSYPRVRSLRWCNLLYAFARDRAHLPDLRQWDLLEQRSLDSMNTPALPGRYRQKFEVSSKGSRRGPVLRPYSLAPNGGRFSGCSLKAENLRRGTKMRLDRVPYLPTSPEIWG